MKESNKPVKGFYINGCSRYPHRGDVTDISIGTYDRNGGCVAEFGLRWHDLGPELRLVPRSEIPEDFRKVLIEMERLRELAFLRGRNATEQDIIDCLLELGFKDLTTYTNEAPEPSASVVTADPMRTLRKALEEISIGNPQEAENLLSSAIPDVIAERDRLKEQLEVRNRLAKGREAQFAEARQERDRLRARNAEMLDELRAIGHHIQVDTGHFNRIQRVIAKAEGEGAA